MAYYVFMFIFIHTIKCLVLCFELYNNYIHLNIFFLLNYKFRILNTCEYQILKENDTNIFSIPVQFNSITAFRTHPNQNQNFNFFWILLACKIDFLEIWQSKIADKKSWIKNYHKENNATFFIQNEIPFDCRVRTERRTRGQTQRYYYYNFLKGPVHCLFQAFQNILKNLAK